MDKQTLSNYGWIVVCVMVLAVLLALASPFGSFVATAVKSTTQGLFDVNQNALNIAGIVIGDQEFESCVHDYEVTTTATCDNAGITTYTCKLCNQTHSEETQAGHQFDGVADMECNKCNITFTSYTLTASNFDSKIGTTIATDKDVVIPETFSYNGTNYKVTSLGNMAFDGCSSLETIVLPNSIKTFGNSVFYGCSSLKSIKMPENLTKIGALTFSGCTSLTSIILPDTLTLLGNGVFVNCRSLTDITLPKNLSIISENVFRSCTTLTKLELPNTVTSIGESAFYNCQALETINFAGTMSEWNNIEIHKNWKDLSAIKQIICSDGTINV